MIATQKRSTTPLVRSPCQIPEPERANGARRCNGGRRRSRHGPGPEPEPIGDDAGDTLPVEREAEGEPHGAVPTSLPPGRMLPVVLPVQPSEP